MDQLGRELTPEHTGAGLGATVEGDVGKLIDTGRLHFVSEMDEKRIGGIRKKKLHAFPVSTNDIMIHYRSYGIGYP